MLNLCSCAIEKSHNILNADTEDYTWYETLHYV